MALFSIALILSALAAVALKAGNLSACFSLGAMAALVLYLCVISWKSERLDKDRIMENKPERNGFSRGELLELLL